jgi:gliding motility-associated-like protein
VDGFEDNKYFSVVNGGLYWSSEEALAGRTSFNIKINVTDRDGNVLEKVFTITRLRKSLDEIEIYNTFTPNGDGINDTWGVPQLAFYSGVRIQVFEKSGERVFYTENPQIRWNGTFDGKHMPIGSYYWVLEVRETGDIKRGILNLLRN